MKRNIISFFILFIILNISREVISYNYLINLETKKITVLDLYRDGMFWVEGVLSMGYFVKPLTGRCSTEPYKSPSQRYGTTPADYFGCDKFQIYINRKKK